MMKDEKKIKKQLISELAELRQRVAVLEKVETEALKESEERLKIIFESIQHGTVIIDAETHVIIDANPVAIKMIGVPKEQVIGFVCHKYICPAEKGRCPITDLGQTVDNSERVLLTANGKKIPILKSVIPIMFRGYKQLLECFVDITELKQADTKLVYERDLLRTFLDTIPISVYCKDRSGRLLYVSKSFYKQYGEAYGKRFGLKLPKDVIGKTDFDLFLKEHTEKMFEDDKRVMEKREAIIDKLEDFSAPDGTKQYSITTKVPWYDEKGNIIGLVGVTRDVTEQIKLEKELTYERNLFANLMENLPLLAYFKDRGGKLIRVSKLYQMTQPESVIGKTDFDLFPEELARTAAKDDKRVMKTKEPIIDKEENTTHQNGSKSHLLSTKAPIFDEKGNVVGTVGVTRDNTELKQAEEEVQRRIVELATLNEIGRAIASTIELDELWELIYQQTCRLMEVSAFYIALYDREKEELYNVINLLNGQPRLRGEKHHRFGKGRTEYIIRTSKPLLILGEVQATYDRLCIVSADKRTKSFAGVPIAVGGKMIGVLAVQNYERDDAYDEHTIELLSAIANQAAIAIENARLYEKTQQLAITDGLTGLYNYRHFYETLENELQRSERYQLSFSLIILDIDNFKVYNDRHGHLAGDNLLMELAQLMSRVARTPDTLARYGGEEFTIILPETDTEQARSLAQRLLDDVRKHCFAIQDGKQTIGRLTISLGVATYPHHAHSAKALVDAADKAMLQAKRAGKNRIAVLRDGEYRK